MRICMVVYDMQAFGGLEEYAVALARGLQEEGHQVSILSAGWVPPDNQYLRRLREDGIRVVQWPGFISRPASIGRPRRSWRASWSASPRRCSPW